MLTSVYPVKVNIYVLYRFLIIKNKKKILFIFDFIFNIVGLFLLCSRQTKYRGIG